MLLAHSSAIQRLASRDAAATSCHNFHRDTSFRFIVVARRTNGRALHQEPLARVGARGEATL